jgi:Flp pilus assembly protein TadG
MLRRWLGNQRGSALLFTTVMLLFLLVLGGIAVDLAYLSTAKGELQRAMDAAALAGAGKLGFDDTAFPTAREWSRQFGALNPYREVSGGLINLDLNAANNPDGDIVLGVWQNNGFAPSLDGSVVNAVRCQWSTTVPTTFLRLLGFTRLPVSAQAIAVSNPPLTPPPDSCLFPIGVGSCPFQGTTSRGCGAPITFITSSGKVDDEGAGCLAPPCDNTAAWVNLEGGDANAEYLKQAIGDAAGGGCTTSSLQTGDSVETNNGMIQSVMNLTEQVFRTKWAESAGSTHEIRDANGDVVYSGQGWKVYIPVIQTACPAGAISGSRQIIGWTEMVITQVINKGECAVENRWPGNAWDPVGKAPNCTGENTPQNSGSLRALFGYYSCTLIPANPSPTPVPRSALATRLRLVN